MSGFIYRQMNDGRIGMMQTCCGCRHRLYVPCVEVVMADGVWICPACGWQDPLDRGRCEHAADLARGGCPTEWAPFLVPRG